MVRRTSCEGRTGPSGARSSITGHVEERPSPEARYSWRRERDTGTEEMTSTELLCLQQHEWVSIPRLARLGAQARGRLLRPRGSGLGHEALGSELGAAPGGRGCLSGTHLLWIFVRRKEENGWLARGAFKRLSVEGRAEPAARSALRWTVKCSEAGPCAGGLAAPEGRRMASWSEPAWGRE